MIKNFLLTLGCTLCVTLLFAQSQSTLKGKVTEPDGQEAIGASISLIKAGVVKTGVVTDYEGNYSINTDGGTYDVEVTYVGMKAQRFTKVTLLAGQITKLDVKLNNDPAILDEVVITEYKVPLIRMDQTSAGGTLTSEAIKNLPTRNISAMVSTVSGVSSNDGGGEIRIKGSRDGNTLYMVDGMRVNKEALPPAQEIDQLQVITGGIEAQYGDVTGGIIAIQTKGPSSKFSGGVELETSKFLDPYDNNLVNANISGPIIKRKGSTVLGFRLAGNLNLNKDASPSAVDLITVSPAKLAELQANPVRRLGSAVVSSGEFLRSEDVTFSKFKTNDNDRRYDINGKLDARVSKNIDITLSGQYASAKNRFAVDPGGALERQAWSVMNYDRNPYELQDRFRTNLRFRHRLGGSGVSDDNKKGSLIQNATYTLQFGYENTKRGFEDLVHKNNLFDYGYVGEFKDRLEPILGTTNPFTQDSIWHQGNRIDFAGYKAGDKNPILTNYNKFAEEGSDINLFLMRNGFYTETYRNAWSYRNVGQVYNNIQKDDNDLVNVNVNSSFDIVPSKGSNNRHTIQFGLVYEQRTNRQYVLRPFRLWEIGNQLADQHFNGLQDGSKLENGLQKPLKIIGDTLVTLVQGGGQVKVPLYANYTVPNLDGKFYLDARAIKKIGVDEHLNINILNPGDLRLDMFSARELSQNQLVEYYGFDYLGNKQTGNISFEDFFTKEDASGIRVFPIAAQRPLYTAAFIQDKFQFKDIIFRFGLRVDRYDANTKVLKDPYSLYDVMNASDFYTNVLKNAAGKPGTIGDDFKVYINDPAAQTPSVRAFRDGDQWYNAQGTTVNDANLIFNGAAPDPQYSDPRAQQNKDWIKDRSFDTKNTFTDYVPQINLMPRLAFSFPISDDANFFANYDVLVSRPTSNAAATALDYFYFADAGRVTEDNPIDNPNLKPEKTIYYEVGFQQKLTNSSALKLTAYYKELRDMIQRRSYLYVPIVNNYFTYGNIDFGTVKGFTLGYDLRRTGNVSMNVSYTLQFADATGSDANSQKGLTSRGNLRSIFPLSYDERHNIQAIIDYRFDEGKKYNGPKVAGINLLENFGVSVIASAVSGTPYTSKLIPDKFGGSGTVGTINGARIPWRSTFDLRVDKVFALGKGENATDLNVSLRVQNILNTRNIKSVYAASGSATNDGYLQSEIGQQEVGSITEQGRDTQSFLDAYHWALLNPGAYNQPRRIFLGASFYF